MAVHSNIERIKRVPNASKFLIIISYGETSWEINKSWFSFPSEFRGVRAKNNFLRNFPVMKFLKIFYMSLLNLLKKLWSSCVRWVEGHNGDPLNLCQNKFKMAEGVNLKKIWEFSNSLNLVNIDLFMITRSKRYTILQIHLHRWCWMREEGAVVFKMWWGVNKRPKFLDHFHFIKRN